MKNERFFFAPKSSRQLYTPLTLQEEGQNQVNEQPSVGATPRYNETGSQQPSQDILQWQPTPFPRWFCPLSKERLVYRQQPRLTKQIIYSSRINPF